MIQHIEGEDAPIITITAACGTTNLIFHASAELLHLIIRDCKDEDEKVCDLTPIEATYLHVLLGNYLARVGNQSDSVMPPTPK